MLGHAQAVVEVLLCPFHESGWRRCRGGVEPIVDGCEVAVGVVLGFRHVFVACAGDLAC